VSDSNPRIATVLDQMRAVYRLLSVPREGPGQERTRPLTRLHLHTLAYQVLTSLPPSQFPGRGGTRVDTPTYATSICPNEVPVRLVDTPLMSVAREGARQEPTRPLTIPHFYTLAYQVRSVRVNSARVFLGIKDAKAQLFICLVPVPVYSKHYTNCTVVRHTGYAGQHRLVYTYPGWYVQVPVLTLNKCCFCFRLC
jgi:hypothetical protein